MRYVRCAVSLVLVVVFGFITGCQSESPSDPGMVVHLTMNVHAESALALRKAKLTLDQREVAMVDLPGGTTDIMLDGTISGVKQGEHTIRVFVLDQASSPTRYVVGGAVTTSDRILDLASVEGLIATGDAVEFKTTF